MDPHDRESKKTVGWRPRNKGSSRFKANRRQSLIKKSLCEAAEMKEMEQKERPGALAVQVV